MVEVALGDKVPQLEAVALAEGVVDDDELYLHLLGQDVLDVDAHGLPGPQVGAALGEAREVGRDLDEGAVLLHAPHDAHHRFAHRKGGSVLGPGTQQLPDGQHEPPLCVPALDGAEDLLPHADPVGRGGDTAHRHTVDGQQGADAAAYVTERAEGLDVGHDAGQDVAGLELVEVFGLAHPLGFSAGEAVDSLSVFVGVDALDDKAGGPAYPRQYGDVPYAAGVGPVGALPEGHYSPAAAQLEPELTLGVEGQRRALQDLTAGHRGPQFGGAQAGSIAVVVFGTKRLHHLSFLFLCFLG